MKKVKIVVLVVMVLSMVLMSTATFASGAIKLKEYYPGGGGSVDWIQSVKLYKSEVVSVGVSFNLWATVYVDHHFDENGNETTHIINASQSVGLTGIGLDVDLTNDGSSHFIYNNDHNIDISGYGTVKISADIGGQRIVEFKRVNLTISYSVF